MSDLFEREFYARWGDMDFNKHMSNTTYLDVAGDIRMMFFEAHGFPMARFEQLRVGPVILRDELSYFREIKLLERFTVNLLVSGFTPNLERWEFVNEFYRADKKLCARVKSVGGWLSFDTRRMVAPVDDLSAVLECIPKAGDYRTLESPSS